MSELPKELQERIEKEAIEKYKPSGYNFQLFTNVHDALAALQQAYIAGATAYAKSVQKLERELSSLKAGGWVSVKERRSEIAEKVLCWITSPDESGAFIGFRANGGWYVNVSGGRLYIANDTDVMVTHWQPLPAPPTVDK